MTRPALLKSSLDMPRHAGPRCLHPGPSRRKQYLGIDLLTIATVPKQLGETRSEGCHPSRLPRCGFSVIAMTWGPGQGTPIHDHCGMWCVEGVWHGSLEITPYELTAQEDGRYHFEPRGTMYVGPGSAGSLIPPHEYHTIRNPSKDEIAVTLHVYRGAMTECSVFRPVDERWYSRDQRQLSLDATH